MWKLYLQYYLWRALPRWFKQPHVLIAQPKELIAGGLVSKTYVATFNTSEECFEYVKYLSMAGFAIAYRPYVKEVEAFTGPETIEFEIEFTVMGQADNYRMQDMFSRAKYITVISTDVQDPLVTQNAKLVPWLPGMKG